MLQTENRLTKIRDFNLLVVNGRWFNSPNFSLRALNLKKDGLVVPTKENRNTFVEQLRVGFTVGLKISKSAVKRNRLKRQMRETVRLLIKDNKMLSGYYFLFVAKAGAVGLEYKKIEEQLVYLLKHAGCIK